MKPRPGTAPVPRLYLLTPQVGEGAALPGNVAGLGEAVRAANAAAVLLRLRDGDERGLINLTKRIAPPVQDAGAALILDGRAGIVARAGADGAHLAGPAAFEAALPRLKPDFVVGAGGLYSRHDAMVAGEAGADYVMFGEPDEAGERPSFEAVIDRIAWWSEIFEIPCVAYAGRLDDIATLAAAGADFVAIGTALFDDPRGLAAAASDAGARLTEPAA
jgi:thiamine-phosphate pyrophosphorylase